MMDMNENHFAQGHYSCSGVVLKRVISPKGDIFLDLFLKEMGIIWAIAPGSAKGKVRFGGALEPSSWGIFTLYKGARNFYLQAVDTKADSWVLRQSPKTLRTYFAFLKLINRHVPRQHPDDKVLANLFWTRELLLKGCQEEVVEWRFLWKWLNLWGLAPQLDACMACGNSISEGLLCTEGFLCRSCISDEDTLTLSVVNLRVLKKAVMLSRGRFQDFCNELDDVFLQQFRRGSLMLKDILSKQI